MSKTILTILMLLAGMHCIHAQQVNHDSLSGKISQLSGEITNLKKVKLSGYLQAQWQKAESKGISTFNGGSFEPDADNRFMLRRGRLKMTYASDPISIVLQTDVTEKGVGIRDAYATFNFPGKMKNLSLTGGIFHRPFGHELLYSSSRRESPERAIAVQTLLTNERDVGFKFSYELKPLTFEAAIVNGNSIATDNDSKKDFIGRISTERKLGRLQIGGGISHYNGSVKQGSKYAYHMKGAAFAIKDSSGIYHSTRRYTGADIQLGIPNDLGLTTLRVEFITGKQPGSNQSSASPKSASISSGDTYIRPFNAAIVYFIQDLGKSNLQAVFKYDFYDPNTKVAGAETGAASTRTSDADLKYSTFGIGLNYNWKNMLVMAYYDIVKNETSGNLANFGEDLKDNVFTLRLQFKY